MTSFVEVMEVNMETICELVGGPCDGVQFDVDDPNEPDDVPDVTTASDKRTGATERYFIDPKQLKSGKPMIRGNQRVWRYIADSLLGDE